MSALGNNRKSFIREGIEMKYGIICSFLLIMVHGLLAQEFESGEPKWLVPSEKSAYVKLPNKGKLVVDRERVTLLIWNAHKEVFTPEWQEELGELAAGVDFILLQESITKVNFWLSKYFYPEVYDRYSGRAGFSFYYLGKFNGNVTLTPYEAVAGRVLHTKDREPMVNTVKPILITRYLLGDGRFLTLANIHAINFVSTGPFRRQVERGLEYLQQFDGPIVFAGDFNCWSEEKYNILHELMRKAGFIKVNLENLDLAKRVFDKVIDHVFVRSVRHATGQYIKNRTSDHTPMRVILDL